jgi:hypothetical protein
VIRDFVVMDGDGLDEGLLLLKLHVLHPGKRVDR